MLEYISKNIFDKKIFFPDITNCRIDEVSLKLSWLKFEMNKTMSVKDQGPVCIDESDRAFIEHMEIYFPDEGMRPGALSSLTYNKQANSSCLKESHPELFDILVTRFFQFMSGSRKGSVNDLMPTYISMDPEPHWMVVDRACIAGE